MWTGVSFKELTSSPGQLAELANLVRQIPSVHGNLPSLFRKQIAVHDGYSFFTVGTTGRTTAEVILPAECRNKNVSLLGI